MIRVIKENTVLSLREKAFIATLCTDSVLFAVAKDLYNKIATAKKITPKVSNKNDLYNNGTANQ